MKVRYLIYTGNREKGSLVVRQLPATHPFRKLNYVKGQRWRLDYDMPDQIGKYVRALYPTAGFKIIEEEMSNVEALTSQFTRFLETYGELVTPEELMANILGLTIEHANIAVENKDLFDFSFNALIDNFKGLKKDAIEKTIISRVSTLVKKKEKAQKKEKAADAGTI